MLLRLSYYSQEICIISLSRQKNRLISSTIYFGSAVFSLAGLIIADDILDPTAFILSISGISLWGVAAAQSLYRDYHAYRQSISQEVISTSPPLLRSSSHSIINAALYLSSAAAYIAIDLRSPKIQKKLPLYSVLSSLLWIKGACIDLLMASTVERRLETNPLSDTRLCYIDETTYYLASDIDCLLSGILGAIALALDDTTTESDIISNVCWLTASLVDLCQSAMSAQKHRVAEQRQLQHAAFYAFIPDNPDHEILPDVADGEPRIFGTAPV